MDDIAGVKVRNGVEDGLDKVDSIPVIREGKNVDESETSERGTFHSSYPWRRCDRRARRQCTDRNRGRDYGRSGVDL